MCDVVCDVVCVVVCDVVFDDVGDGVCVEIIDFKLFGGFGDERTDGRTNGRTNERTDICTSRVAFATENSNELQGVPKKTGL